MGDSLIYIFFASKYLSVATVFSYFSFFFFFSLSSSFYLFIDLHPPSAPVFSILNHILPKEHLNGLSFIFLILNVWLLSLTSVFYAYTSSGQAVYMSLILQQIQRLHLYIRWLSLMIFCRRQGWHILTHLIALHLVTFCCLALEIKMGMQMEMDSSSLIQISMWKEGTN